MFISSEKQGVYRNFDLLQILVLYSFFLSNIINLWGHSSKKCMKKFLVIWFMMILAWVHTLSQLTYIRRVSDSCHKVINACVRQIAYAPDDGVLAWTLALFNLKNVKNTHGGVLLLKITLLHGCFSRFLNCTNGTSSRNASDIKLLTNFFQSYFLIPTQS